MRTRIFAVLAALGVALGLTLLNPGTASAQQAGLQQIVITNASWSSVSTTFACGSSYVLAPGAWWGEGRPNPQCGLYTYQAEPHHVFVGPGWCISRWITNDGGYNYGKQVIYGGSNGVNVKMWQDNYWPNLNQISYTNHVESWNGSGCPATGPAGEYHQADGSGAYEWQL